MPKEMAGKHQRGQADCVYICVCVFIYMRGVLINRKQRINNITADMKIAALPVHPVRSVLPLFP